MELLNAHIINFGKLHEKDFDFKKGINSFQYENGWGKTTLSAFIKAMLYGMEYTSSKDVSKNEKLKYSPWQGGKYGGSLSFEQDGKKYKINRTFGLKKNEDTFELIDLKTNKLSTDFSEDLGNEIFKINRETYGRSVYVTLSETPAGSTDISAKLNNLVEADDVTKYDDAIEVLEKKATAIKAKRGKNDLVSNLQDRIDSDRNYLDDIKSKIKQNADYSQKITGIEDQIKTKKAEYDALTQDLSKIAKYESKIRYEQLKDDLVKAQENKNVLLDFFNGKIPTNETVKNIDIISERLTTIESNIENLSATQSEINTYESLRNYFAGDIPSTEQINNCLKLDTEYKNYKQTENRLKLTADEESDYNTLKTKYYNSDITEELITSKINEVEYIQNQQKQLNDKQNELTEKKKDLAIAQAIKPKNMKRIICFIISFLFLAGGIAGFIINNIILGIAGLVLSVVCIILGIIFKSAENDTSNLQNEVEELKKQVSLLQDEVQKNDNNLKLFISKYSTGSSSELIALTNIKTEFNNYLRLNKKNAEYEKWISEQTKKPENYEAEIKMFAKRYCKTDDISAITNEIQALNEKLAKLDALEKKVNADSDNGKAQAEEKEKLVTILKDYKTDKTLNYKEQVLQIHNTLTDINNADKLITDAKQNILDFENDSNNDIKAFATLEKPEKSADELQEELSNISDEIAGLNKTISDYQKIIDDNSADTDKKEDVEAEIEKLKDDISYLTNENKLLLKTSELLKQAKEKLDANYSDPMKDGFAKYINMMEGNKEGPKLLINTDLEVSVDDNGQTHESIYLSDGYKDMVNFCSRMALVDALFKDVKPPVILDDPFVNLDDDKVPKALQLVKDMSKDNQILYFACHKSREI